MAEKESRSSKMYKDSPKLERNADSKKVEVKKGGGEKSSGKKEGKGDGAMDMYQRHAKERLELHHKHEKEHMEMAQQHMQENGMGEGAPDAQGEAAPAGGDNAGEGE